MSHGAPTPAEVLNTLNSIAKSSAPTNENFLRFEYLKDALSCPAFALARKTNEVLGALTNLYLGTWVPPAVHVHFCGGKFFDFLP